MTYNKLVMNTLLKQLLNVDFKRTDLQGWHSVKGSDTQTLLGIHRIISDEIHAMNDTDVTIVEA